MLIAQELDWWELGSFCLQVTWNKSCTAVWALTAAAYCLQANLVSQMIHDSACLVKLLRFFCFFLATPTVLSRQTYLSQQRISCLAIGCSGFKHTLALFIIVTLSSKRQTTCLLQLLFVRAVKSLCVWSIWYSHDCDGVTAGTSWENQELF